MSEADKKIREIELFLESIPKFSNTGRAAANFDLSRMRKFCEKMGDPQNKFKSIHVAGTNGKGTVCRMLASAYQQAGYKTGLYTSPHLVDVKERFRINAQQINNDKFIEFFDRYGQYISESKITYFEITTAIAFWYFAKEEVDIALIEVGLGGRLDATNVITPLAGVITSVGLDHTDILGHSLEAIALEKAGIIKKNIPVVIGNLAPEAEHAVQTVAESKNSGVIQTVDLEPEYGNDKIILSGIPPGIVASGSGRKIIDAWNVAVAYKVIETLTPVLPVSLEQFIKGIENVNTRFSRHAVFEKIHPEKLWYFDGAHNEQSVETLVNHLLTLAPANRWSVVLSFMKDKLNTKIAGLWNKFPRIYLYEMEGDRAATVNHMESYFPSAREIKKPDFLKSDQFKSELVIFSGSFYFYSIVSNWMGAIASADQKNPSAL